MTELPDKPGDQWFAACGVADSPLGGKDIVVAGGNDNDEVNIFNTEMNAWRPGPPLGPWEGIVSISLEGVSEC